MNDLNVINIAEKFTQIKEPWSPHIIASMDDYHLKLAKIEGEFIWHSHKDADEAFIVISGTLKILFRDGEVALNKGELYVVPKGIEHKPVASPDCKIMLIERNDVVNTGDEESDRRKDNLPKI